jgi:class 3 adenylate cyclase
MTAAALVCGSCGTELPPNSKFCNECGAVVATATTPAEYKQVTVLFADVVHSMNIATAVGAERLREIMAGLVDRAAAVVRRYGGMVDKFTGDGIMALFGAPVALEDHALRACRAALEIHRGISDLAQEVSYRDGVELQLRIGLNSGQVIAGEIGSGAMGYTAIGEQVGMAQRMESVAPPGRVMLSESTRRLVEGAVVLGEPELVQIKGADEPVLARGLLGMGEQQRVVRRAEPNLVGRRCARWRRWRVAAAWKCLRPSASRTPARSPSMPSHDCCARPPAWRVLMGRLPATACAPGFPMQTPRIWRSSLTCWGSRTLRWPFLGSIRMRVGGG